MKKIVYAFLLLSVTFNVYFISNKILYSQNNKNYHRINYMDDISKIKISGEKKYINNNWGSNKLIVMLKQECSSCYNILPIINELSNVIQGTDKDIIIIWDKQYPEENYC
ncbi:hypothetical protein [Peptostreptococcus sp. D1]|uniref:hypothetical protein n=1 Tax=Peptostreptococcus sp. D1 TaxID=72304 RepID=UPI0008EBA931|nr:hypothetical protein [Peptostreptococcus sp. D1]SFE67173.1 hypothetical protein SAMN02910278_01413 [Peptostreptococcus sp. D1]